ncbi:MAG: M1 family metallopeptidase [Thermoplasmata archaeon]|nr:M1 family metallopeptidase [Thermoplasmata archaeon]
MIPVRAEEYHLSLDVDFRNRTFRGHVRLLGDLDGPLLRLNCVGLEVRRANAGSHALTCQRLEASQEIQLDGIPSDAREVELDFSGKVLDQSLLGLYRSEQPPEYVLATQFESTGARRVFPCLDRPDQKATFEVEVTVDSDLVVIFNTPALETTVHDGRQRIRFAKTPRMATYLLFFGIGKFDSLQGDGPGTQVGVWTPPGESEKGRFALDVSQRVLREFEDYYDVPYPLPKLDLISIREFGAGAMENWGAIASRERLLLVDERTTSGLRRAIATVAAHEIAHQWFGDLVTMVWWDDIWLNESFASFMAYKVLDRLGGYPGIWSDFLLTETASAFLGDSLATTHPIRQAVDSPEEIDQIFDEISYGKGASVLRMLEAFVGAVPFRQGVHDYLVKFQYGNARGEDLWAALEAAAQQPISDLMRRWVERPGHPVLIVHRGADGLHLEQRRFSISGEHTRQFWPVPLVARTDGKSVRMLMTGPEITLNVPADSDIFLNEGALGFYRVLYDGATYDRILGRFDQLPAPERWLVLEDLFAFLLSADVSFERYQSFVEKALAESDPLVVQGVLHHLSLLVLPLMDDPKFVDLYRGFHRAQTRRLGLARKPDESDMDRRLRESILRSRLLLDPDFARELSAKFGDYDGLDADIRPAVAVAYAQVGGARVVEELWQRLRGANDADALQMTRALATFEDPALVAETLARASRGEMPFSQVPWAVFEALRHPQSRPVVWKWFQEDGARLMQGLAGTSFLHFVYEELVAAVGTDDPGEVRAYFAEHPVAGAERGILKGIEYAGLFSELRARRARERGTPTSKGYNPGTDQRLGPGNG